MEKMEELQGIYSTKDKWQAPLLLSASFSGLVEFRGSFEQNGTLYWSFTPRDKAVELLVKFQTKLEPRIPSKDLFEAIEVWWRQVAAVRNGEMKNGEINANSV